MSQYNYLSFISIVILILNVHWSVEGAPHRSTLRLCSKGLSDALYLVCKGRGYNEPFSYADGIESAKSSGPGLVDECCRRSCSLEHLEQYCKPLASGENSNGAIEASMRIVNLPFSSRQTVSKAGVENEGKIKNKIRGWSDVYDFPNVFNKQMESLENSGRRRQDRGKSMKTSKRNDIRQSFLDNGQHRRKKWRHCTQVKLKASLKKVPNFVIGTILPEPNDSLVLFPSKSYQDYWRVTQNFASDVNKLEITMQKTYNSSTNS